MTSPHHPVLSYPSQLSVEQWVWDILLSLPPPSKLEFMSSQNGVLVFKTEPTNTELSFDTTVEQNLTRHRQCCIALHCIEMGVLKNPPVGAIVPMCLPSHQVLAIPPSWPMLTNAPRYLSTLGNQVPPSMLSQPTPRYLYCNRQSPALMRTITPWTGLVTWTMMMLRLPSKRRAVLVPGLAGEIGRAVHYTGAAAAKYGASTILL